MNVTVKQIEADVVITLVNPECGAVRSHPLWECELTFAQLAQCAAQYSLHFAEECGGGCVTATIQDFRGDDAQ